MTGAIKLKEITISGFRGYGENPITLDLSSPAVIFSGKNRSGKSSTLNAIEWAIYGNEVIGSGKTNIEERKKWLIKNMNSTRAKVELILETGKGEIRVRRSTTGGKKGMDFCFYDENGDRHEDENDLWQLLGLGPRDFMSTVYLHQEVIRDIVTSAPSIRKDAINRLLGLSNLRNLYDAFSKISRKDYESIVEKRYEAINDLIAARQSSYREDKENAKEEGEKIGLQDHDYKPDKLAKKSEQIVVSLEKIAQKATVQPAQIDPIENPEEFDDFSKRVMQEKNRLMAENPAAKSSKDLVDEQRKLDRRLSEYMKVDNNLKELKNEKHQIEIQYGKCENIEKKIETLEDEVKKLNQELSTINARLPVIHETIIYLESFEEKEKPEECPVCEQEIMPLKLEERLKKLKEEYKEKSEEIEQRISEAKKEQKDLKNAKKRLIEITEVDIPEESEKCERALEELETLLGKKIDPNTDPVALVRKRIGAIEKELEESNKILQDYLAALSEVDRLLDEARIIADVIALDRKIAKIAVIKQSPEWQELREAERKISAELDLVEKLKETIEDVLKEVSKEKILAVSDRVVDFYKELVERPDFDRIEIDDENFEIYAVKDGQRCELVKFFNQGDMNCAAIAIFLALGTAHTIEKGGVGFTMLDDPSQSLDNILKERLVKVLDKLPENIQLVLATMDSELLDLAKSLLSRKKKIYNFGEWHHVRGPVIAEG